jgi:hypothetical protein
VSSGNECNEMEWSQSAKSGFVGKQLVIELFRFRVCKVLLLEMIGEIGNNSGTQIKRNISRWKPLHSSDY